MDTVVTHGMKIDLHIHSSASSKKDGKKVKNNTLKNIPTLISKLNENGVNICAITDHDTFSYKMYKALKKAECDETSIRKVLPGVEFSVRFLDSNGNERDIHIVSIFSDVYEEKVANIENVLKVLSPDNKGSYTEENFLRTLREIDLDTILIAHQKNTLTSQKPRKNDANSLGEEKFLELVATDFFEAYEFKNKRNEILNKSHLLVNNLEEKVRFVTGTDCHDWSVYPREDCSDNTIDFPYTFAKCLPTFKGLVMAVTDHMRLKRVDSFFNPDKFALDFIEIENNNETIKIPLSRGINVIIGDNSIGKSMLLHALTGFEKDGEELSKSIRRGYKGYIAKNNLKIKKQIKKENIFAFDMQGEVRSKFEQNRLVSTEFAKYFPKNINPQPYKTIIHNEIERLVEHLEKKFKLDSDISKLRSFGIYIDEETPESLSFVGKLRNSKTDTSKIESIITAIKQVEIDFLELLKLTLDEDDAKYFSEQSKAISKIRSKYQKRKDDTDIENDKIEIVAKVIDSTAKRHTRSISDRQKKNTAFLEKTTLLKDSLTEIIRQSQEVKNYSPSIEETDVAVASKSIQDYNFISKVNVTHIDAQYFMHHVHSVFKSNKKIDINTITESQLKDSLLKYDGFTPVLQFFKDELIKSFKEDFVSKQTITLKELEKTAELSAGLNAKIYFDLLSYENNLDGIYIIDQPEDNVSQPSIKAHLLDCFKVMGENRQVIMVSHNPQFIVNLDVDNLIYISRAADGKLMVQSGALEYECNDYGILQIVADNIDGGLDSIQKRWKRYEKVNRV